MLFKSWSEASNGRESPAIGQRLRSGNIGFSFLGHRGTRDPFRSIGEEMITIFRDQYEPLPYNPIPNFYQRLFDAASPEFRACMAVGCEMETSSLIDENGIHVTMTTKNLVAAVQEQGRTVVYENKLA